MGSIFSIYKIRKLQDITANSNIHFLYFTVMERVIQLDKGGSERSGSSPSTSDSHETRDYHRIIRIT